MPDKPTKRNRARKATRCRLAIRRRTLTVFPPQAQVIAPRQGVGVYACVVRLEPAGNEFWMGEIPCRWDGQQWSREDGGRLRYGIQQVKSFIG
jgi:hypothetical protein